MAGKGGPGADILSSVLFGNLGENGEAEADYLDEVRLSLTLTASAAHRLPHAASST
jgi:hypothetical protein